jgi:SpoU rRNA methylase family enzyme
LKGPFPAVVLEQGKTSRQLGVRTVLNTLSATDFCLQLAHRVRAGEELLVITQLSNAILLLRGEVTKVQKEKAGSYNLSLVIKKHQIFSLAGGSTLEKFYQGDSQVTPSQMSDGPVTLEFGS